MQNWLVLSLAVMVSVHSCRGYPWPADCKVQRFEGSLCWLNGHGLEDPGNRTGDVLQISGVDCTVPHLKLNWTSAPDPEELYRCFQPLYRCTWNSTELGSQAARRSLLATNDHTERTLEDTSIELPVGSECTFGGCYLEYNPTLPVKEEWYQLYWIEPVTCTINNNGCVKNPNACDINADCSDIIGSFECTCQSGYTGNGTYCQDVDECSTGLHNCSDYANCSNTEEGFVCQCQTGFTGDGFNCTNVDECLEGLHGCHQNAECSDTEGGYRCSCETGFVGDGYSCEIGPLIGVLGIGVPALLFLVVCAVAMATCGMVIRNRQKVAALQYMEYFFPWKEPLKPDFEPVDADRRISFTLSIESVFDSLIKPEKTPESAHSTSDGSTTDISFEDTQLLPAHKDRDLASDGKVEAAIGHQMVAHDVSKMRAVVEDGLQKSPASVQINVPLPSHATSSSTATHSGYVQENSAIPSSRANHSGYVQNSAIPSSTATPSGYVQNSAVPSSRANHSGYVQNSAVPSSRTNHSGYVEDSSATTPPGGSKYVSSQQQGGYVTEECNNFLTNSLITPGTSELVSQRDHVQGGNGYVRQGEREGGSGGYVTETGRNAVSWQSDDRELAVDFLDTDQGETEDVILSDSDVHCSSQEAGYIHDGRNPTSGMDTSTGYLSHSAVLASPVLQTQSRSVPPAYISDSSLQVQTAHSELNHVQDGANRDAVTSASGYTLSGTNIVRPETGGYVSYQRSTDSGYVHSSISTEYWAETMGESLSIHLEAEDEEVFASDTVLPEVDGYIQDSMGPPQPSITPHSPIQSVKTDYVTVDESSFIPLQCTTNHHLDGGYIQNPPMTDCHTTDIIQCLPQPSMDHDYEQEGLSTSGYITYHENLELPTGTQGNSSGASSGYVTA